MDEEEKKKILKNIREKITKASEDAIASLEGNNYLSTMKPIGSFAEDIPKRVRDKLEKDRHKKDG